MTRLLIVDDSALMRRLLGDVFAAAGGFELAYARDGREALGRLHEFNPDVVTLDVQMPGVGGLECLDRIMLERPCRVVMVSATTGEGAEATLQALELGAVDFVEKPSGAVSLKMDVFAPRLLETVRTAAAAHLRPALRLTERVRLRAAALPPRRSAQSVAEPGVLPASSKASVDVRDDTAGVVLVGCSTGGPPALEALLSALPADFGWPVVVAQHMPASFTGALARRLDRVCALNVQEVSGPTPLRGGTAYIGQGDADVLVAQRRKALIALPAPAEPEARWRPSVDRLVHSAMGVVPAHRLLGVLMTGMGDDGASQMLQLHRAGGLTLAEAEESAVVWGMPGALARNGGAGEIVPLASLADRLIKAIALR